MINYTKIFVACLFCFSVMLACKKNTPVAPPEEKPVVVPPVVVVKPVEINFGNGVNLQPYMQTMVLLILDGS